MVRLSQILFTVIMAALACSVILILPFSAQADPDTRNAPSSNNRASNSIDLLMNGSVEPSTALRSSEIVCSVTYIHPHNVAPLWVYVIIDNMSLHMQQTNVSASNYDEGVQFIYPIPPRSYELGNHTVTFMVITQEDNITFYYNQSAPPLWLDVVKNTKGEDISALEEQCCMYTLIFVFGLFMVVLIHNILTRRKQRSQQLEYNRTITDLNDIQSSTMNDRSSASGSSEPSELQDGIQATFCSECGGQVPIGSPFCPRCGEFFEAEEEYLCSNCGHLIKATDEFCPKCKTRLMAYSNGQKVSKRTKRRLKSGSEKTKQANKLQRPDSSLSKPEDAVSKDTLKEDDFMCSMCSAAVPAQATKCPHCGTEFS